MTLLTGVITEVRLEPINPDGSVPSFAAVTATGMDWTLEQVMDASSAPRPGTRVTVRVEELAT